MVPVPPLKPLYILQAIVTPNNLLLRTAQFEECPLLPVRELELQKSKMGKMQEATKVSKLASAVQWAERIMRKIDNVQMNRFSRDAYHQVDVVENASGLRRTCNRNEGTPNRRDDPCFVFHHDRSSGTPLGFPASARVFPMIEGSPGARPRSLRTGLPNREVGLLDPPACRPTRFQRDTRRENRSTAGPKCTPRATHQHCRAIPVMTQPHYFCFAGGLAGNF
jgi:hypothetical protein